MDCAMDCSPLSSLRLSLPLEDMQDLAGARKTLRSGEVDMLGSLGPLGSLGIPGMWQHALARASYRQNLGRNPSALSLTLESAVFGMLFTQE